MGSLKAEIQTLKSFLPKGVTLSRLHWGGGTPTLLHPEMVTELSEALHDLLPWEPDAEFSVEIDPNEIDPHRLSALVAAGMNRTSIGVQDFNPRIQKIIGRVQTYEVTRDLVEALRGHGVNSLSADILFGLPEQTPDRLVNSVQQLLSLSPDRVALYGYAHVPWMARRQAMIPTDTLPTPAERLTLFEAASKLFVWDGYEQIGIDHFARAGDKLAQAAKTGRLRRNFQGYTDDTSDVLIGLGASSISKFPQGLSQNAPATAKYQGAVRAGALATDKGHVFSADDLLRGRLIEALMCDFRIDRTEILENYTIDPGRLDVLFAQAASAFPDMVEINAKGFKILRQGRPLTRVIARSFDVYDAREGSHSGTF
jgi:oxygen-independent coproporphyrinogen-3 oxidase